MSRFTKAVKTQYKLKLALCGPAGSGKTFTALRIASGLGKRIALISSEPVRYAEHFAFDKCELAEFSPANYIGALKAATEEGYDVVIIDSLSHAWTGKGGILEMVDKITAKSGSKNAFSTGWREASPEHNKMIEELVAAPVHLIVTIRTKTAYEIEKDKNGRTVPVKIGLAPVQREGLEYEFDVVGDIDTNHRMVITKTRCAAATDWVGINPGEDFAKILRDWCEAGEPAPVAKPQPQPVAPPAQRVDTANLESLIKAAPTLDELAKLVPAIKALPGDEMERLRRDYYAPRKAELGGGN